MRKVLQNSVLGGVFFALTGCASIVSKSDWPVSLQSQPLGATVTVTDSSGKNVYSGVTPTNVTLKSSKGFFKGEKYTVSFEKDGVTTTHQLESRINDWYFGNILFGGLIGLLIVDPATGAMYKLPDEVKVKISNDLSLNDGKHSLEIITMDQLPAELHSQLIALQ